MDQVKKEEENCSRQVDLVDIDQMDKYLFSKKMTELWLLLDILILNRLIDSLEHK